VHAVREEQPTCHVVRAEEGEAGVTGFVYAAGVSAETVGAQGLCLQLTTIPPGARAKAHKHEAHETAIYLVSGNVDMRFGEQLEQQVSCRAGDFVYIPAGMPHLPWNTSESEPAVALIARTDPNEQESVVLLPELDER
jgi:uncharacterized RmlC-like cupin family protein